MDAELTGVATIEPTSQATVGFPASGTVTSVNVQVGDEVAAGDMLAQLDTAALEQQLHEAEQTLADASLTLANGIAGIKSPTGGSGMTARNVSTVSGSETRIVFTATTIDPELDAARKAVLDAQVAVDAAMTTASTALDNALSVCQPSSSDTGDAEPEPDPDACTTALRAVLDAQKAVQTAQNQLAVASITYDDLLAERASTPTTPSAQPTPGNGSAAPSGDAGSSLPSGGGSAPGGGAGAAPGSTSSAPSSADLVAYQKAVDAAQAKAAAAQQAIDQATITTPIAGTVVAVALTVGESVDDATSQNITIQGPSGYEATTTIGVDEISTVKVGQRATVTPDSDHAPLTGSVAAISVSPVSSSTTASYRVTIALDKQGDALHNGGTGTVTIVTEQSDAGLAVPTSAVTTLNGRHFVTVVADGSVRQVAVEVGVVGREWTEVTSGLTAGKRVAIADLDEALPSSATSSNNSGTGTTGPGGLPAGGRFTPGGGFAGR